MGPATDSMLAAVHDKLADLHLVPSGAGITEVPEPSFDMTAAVAAFSGSNSVIDVRDRRSDTISRESSGDAPLASEMAALLESFGNRNGGPVSLSSKSAAAQHSSTSAALVAAPWEGPCVHVQKRGSCAKGGSCKTILCKHHFLEKYCKHGAEECYFAHSEEEQRPAAPFFKPKQRPCTRYLQEGFCVFGKNCIFWHKRPPETCTTSPSASPVPDTELFSSRLQLGAAPLTSLVGSMEPDRALSLAINELQSALRLPIDSRTALLRVLKTMEVAGSVAMDSVVMLGSGFSVLGHQLEWLERVRLFAESIETLRTVLKSANAGESVLAVVMQAVEQSSLALVAVVPPLPLVQSVLKLLVHVARGLQHAFVALVPASPTKPTSKSPSPCPPSAGRVLYLVMSRSSFETLASHLRPLLDCARVGGLVMVSGEGYRTREVPGCEPGALSRHADLFQQAAGGDESLYKLSDGRLMAHLLQLQSAHAEEALFVLFSPALSLPPQERTFDAILAALRTAVPSRASSLIVRSPSCKAAYLRPDVPTVSEDELVEMLLQTLKTGRLSPAPPGPTFGAQQQAMAVPTVQGKTSEQHIFAQLMLDASQSTPPFLPAMPADFSSPPALWKLGAR